ncbi:hypothetical protein niasHS_016471 [Heterodera schachtii]|uniref:Uncharacterized protein n=1 Tax=Heterodera schachtii TaxID=97005 RepID=A0ABD2HNB3_HETSC
MPSWCQLCKVACHPPSQCPAYTKGGIDGGTRVSCLACSGINHLPKQCWVLESWVQWAAAFFGKQREEPLLVEDIGRADAGICFVCLEGRHRWRQCAHGRLRSEWERFRKMNKNVQRHSGSQNWTDIFVSPNGTNIHGTVRRHFYRPNTQIRYTNYMLEHGAVAFAERRKKFDKFIRRIQKERGIGPMRDEAPPVQFTSEDVRHLLQKFGANAEVVVSIGTLPLLLFRVNKAKNVAELFEVYRPDPDGLLLPIPGVLPVATYRFA